MTHKFIKQTNTISNILYSTYSSFKEYQLEQYKYFVFEGFHKLPQ